MKQIKPITGRWMVKEVFTGGYSKLLAILEDETTGLQMPYKISINVVRQMLVGRTALTAKETDGSIDQLWEVESPRPTGTIPFDIQP